MRVFLLLVALVVGTSSAAYKLSVGVAPSIVTGDVDPTLAPWAGRAVAEMLSWEISMVQTIRVADPSSVEKGLVGWEFRTELGAAELDDARTARQQADVEAVLLSRLNRKMGASSLEIAAVVRKNGEDRVVRSSVSGHPDALLGLLRTQVVGSIDSLGISIPASVRQIVASRPSTKWDAILEYGRALRSLSQGNKEDALRSMREALRLDPNLAAALVRTRTLEKELGR
jgi:hypothetical protein